MSIDILQAERGRNAVLVPTAGAEEGGYEGPGRLAFGMWIPGSVDEIEQPVARGGLEETSSFDGKKEMPAPTKKGNASAAVDLAAMSTAGGTILYGVGADASERLTVLSRIVLAGAADRIAQSVGRHENTSGIVMWSHVPKYNAPTYTRTRRLSAASELQDPKDVAIALVGRLFAATAGRDNYTPFQ